MFVETGSHLVWNAVATAFGIDETWWWLRLWAESSKTEL